MKMKDVSKSIKYMRSTLSIADSKKEMLDWKLTKAQTAIVMFLANFSKYEFIAEVAGNYGRPVAKSTAANNVSHWLIRSLERELKETKEITDLEDRQRVVNDLMETLDLMQGNLDHLATDYCRMNPNPQMRIYPKVRTWL